MHNRGNVSIYLLAQSSEYIKDKDGYVRSVTNVKLQNAIYCYSSFMIYYINDLQLVKVYSPITIDNTGSVSQNTIIFMLHLFFFS